MGVIRVLLAAAVVLVHSGGIFTYNIMGGGQIAVQMFYMISGFYMALVLTEKYAASIVDFYVNRALRLFPTYWAVCVGALIVYALLYNITGGGFFGTLAVDVHDLSPALISWAAFSNLCLFGLDWLNAVGEAPRLIIPAWTLGVEITFYLVAPLIVRQKTEVLVALLAVSLASRLAAYLAFGLGGIGTFWAYQFFPFELALFLAGVLAFRFYRQIADSDRGRWLGLSVLPALLLYQVMQKAVTTALPGSTAALVAFWVLSFTYLAVAMPFLFRETRSNTFDAKIGALSYPLYLVHYPLVDLYKGMIDGSDTLASRAIRSCAIMVVSLALAYVLARFVERKIDERRRYLRPALAPDIVAAES